MAYYFNFNLLKYYFFQKENNDIWICSYPRCGNTLLRSVLSDLLIGCKEKPGQNRAVIPDAHGNSLNISKADLINQKYGFRIFKSHFINLKQINFYPKVIYLYRDPLDSIVSWYKREEKKGKIYNIDLKTFIIKNIRNSRYGGWVEHFNSYFNRKNKKEILFVKYEDFIIDPVKNLQGILDFMGISEQFSKDDLEKIINIHYDDFIGSSALDLSQKAKFIYEQQKGKGVRELDREILAGIPEDVFSLRNELGYESINF